MIEPRVLKGFRDTLPDLMIDKKNIIQKLESIFQSFGFAPVDTPALEYTEILLGKGGGETDKQVYRFTDNGGRDVSLRFDLTVPLARFVSEHYNELPFPFKRYHIAPVWRGENTQKGRYREFYQCDFDILGSTSINSDIDILLMIKKGFDVLNAGAYTININHRKVLNSFLKKLKLDDKGVEILRTIDKIYKIGVENVKDELTTVLSIEQAKVEKIIDYLNISKSKKGAGITGEEIFLVLDNLEEQIEIEDKIYLSELKFIFNTFKELGILDCYSYNPAITRGLDYYTGVVFESFINDSIDFGSVCSGGRYDNLTALYSKNTVVGVGASFGLDRLLALLENKKLLSRKNSETDLIIFNLDDKLVSSYQKIEEQLRERGINTEVYLDNKKIALQYKYAEKKSINYIILSGEEEIKNQKYSLKNIKTGEEKKSLNIDEIYNIIKGNR